MPCRASDEKRLLEQLVRAGVDQLLRKLDLGLVGGGLDHRLLELALDGVLVGVAQAAGDVLAQLVERVELRRLGGEVVVELGEALGLDLVHGDIEGRACAAEVARVVLGEGDRRSSARHPPTPRRSAPRSRGSAGRIRARSTGRGPRPPRTARRRPCRGSRRRRGRRSRPGAPRCRGSPSGHASARARRRSPRRRRSARGARPPGPCSRRAGRRGGHRSRSRTPAARPDRGPRRRN